jgi:hypothetical protein
MELGPGRWSRFLGSSVGVEFRLGAWLRTEIGRASGSGRVCRRRVAVATKIRPRGRFRRACR